jgi:hypothetical protein
MGASGRAKSPFASILLGFILALVPAGAWAAPAEVTGVTLDSLQTLHWDFLTGAKGYHVYRSTRSRLAVGDYGDCLVGSHRSLSVGDLADPPAGALYTFIAAGFDWAGEGTLGTSSEDVTRTVPIPCKPARRNSEYLVNGDPGDGVMDGVEPARNPWRT